MNVSRFFKYGFFLLLIVSVGLSAYVWKRYISPPWDEEYAYTKGVQAAVYSFPYVLNSSLRWAWSQPADKVANRATPHDAINHFFHSPALATAEYRDGGSPNNDTAYSVTWAYVDKDPLIISVPAIGTIPGSNVPRYFSMELASFASDNFAYIGTRTTGNQGGNYAVVPKGWSGTLPAGVTLLAEAPTPWFFILGRTLVVNPEDFPTVHDLIQGYKLTALSDWGKNVDKRPYSPALEPVPHYKNDRLGLVQQFWALANKAISENPPLDDERLMSFYRDIHLAPGQRVSDLNTGMQKGMNRAVLTSLMMLPKANQSEYGTQTVNGWKYPPKNFGRTGTSGDFLLRAAMQSLGGIVANDPQEAVYLPAMKDANGDLLSGSKRYKLSFSKDTLPPVNAFWSLTLYDDTNNLTANAIDRYSLGDRSQSLHYDADGGLTLYIGNAEPDAQHSGNWLPAPEGNFYFVLRAYLPKAPIVEQAWTPPSIEPVATY